MEILDLVHKRKAFSRSKDRYKYPHREAMKLRLLLTYDKRPSKNRDMQEVRMFYKEALKLMDDKEESENVRRLITKGLKIDPRFHAFYALKGDLYMRQGKWTEAIKCYESARLTAKFDKMLPETQMEIVYNRQLVESYTKRGDWYYDNDLLLEAASDYEQVLTLRLRDMSVIDVQGKLLEILRKLNKYDAFRVYWDEFIKNANESRRSVLLTEHAEFKIYLREMATARKILLEALELDKDNAKAQELLQVVYNTGHVMAAYTVIWCMHGCYDKALFTIEKGRDCDPYNPGYTVLKTIVLRLSGRLKETILWLESVNKDFHKLLEPSRDTQGSIMGKLSIGQTRTELIKEWYLTRYNFALKCMLNKKYEEASQIIYNNNLMKYYMEPYLLLGDGFSIRGNTGLALEMYLRSWKKAQELRVPRSQKKTDLTERVIDILNSRANLAVREKRAKDAIDISDEVLRMLDENNEELPRLRIQRGNALLNKSRGHFQMSMKKSSSKKISCETAADSLRFVRGRKNDELYRALYGEMEMEEVIDRFAPKRNLPQSLKILMQYS